MGAAVPLWGQSGERTTILGTVTEIPAGTAVNGAFVTLVDPSGERLAATLSDQEGRYVLQGSPGRDLRLRVERIGLETVWSDPFSLEDGAVLTRDFRVGTAAVSLEGVQVEVSGSRRCSLDSDQASTTVRLWEEARKALEVAEWVDDVGYRYRMRNFTRQVDRNARTVVSERTVLETLSGRAPVSSLDPDSLAARGFVQRDAGGWAFYGPDAETLLSDAFLSTHCFETVVEEDGVGLAFEPSREHGLPDIRGVLWLRADGGLDRVEFRYVQLEEDMAGLDGIGLAGGEVRFTLLEEGAWVVRDWWIRMPFLGFPQGPAGTGRRRGTEILGYREVGGRMLSAERSGADRTVFDDRTGAVTGRVVRGEAATGVAGAGVFLSGTGYSGRTSADGSFVLDRVRPARYRLVVRHPALDSLGLPGLEREVAVSADGYASLTLPIPTPAEVVADRCRVQAPVPLQGWEDENPGRPIHLGGVVRPPGAQGARGWPVRIRWGTTSLGATGRDVRTRWAGAEQRTARGGAWTFCHLPPEVEVQLSWARRRPEEGSGVSWSPWETLGRPEPGTTLWRVVEPGR